MTLTVRGARLLWSVRHCVAYATLVVPAVCGVFLLACVDAAGDSKQRSTNEPSGDIQKLSKLINLVDAPKSALFTLSPMGKSDGLFGPTDYNLVAVLRYDPISLDRLKSRASRLHSEARRVQVPDRLEWFPAPILREIKRCPRSWCIDGEEYSGTEFLKGGFVTGSFVIPADQEFVILRLGT